MRATVQRVMRIFWFSLVLVLGLISAAALFAQVQLAGPNFWGLTNIQVKPAGRVEYHALEDVVYRNYPVAFLSLQHCTAETEGSIAAIIDSATDVWGNDIIGGSGNHVLAYCNGTHWTVIGK